MLEVRLSEDGFDAFTKNNWKSKRPIAQWKPNAPVEKLAAVECFS
jgi:hypothetical protein